MEVSRAISRALECAILAGRLESAARQYEDKTAASLRRAAAKFRRGCEEALAGIAAGDREGVVSRPAAHWGVGSFRAADGEG